MAAHIANADINDVDNEGVEVFAANQGSRKRKSTGGNRLKAKLRRYATFVMI